MAAPPGPRAARWPAAAVAAALTALCLLLPSYNPSGDAWYYAACARWGQELWQPHHLLYNAAGWLWLRLTGHTGPEAMRWLQALNALAYGCCLLLLGPLLRRTGARPAAVPAWVLLAGGCFGLLRFATDNEAYVLPLLPALGASWFVSGFRFLVSDSAVNNQKPETRNLLLAGTLAALACLLHQVMVWWWLGLLLALRPWRGGAWLRAALLYAAPTLLVPLAYSLAAPEGGVGGALRFALHDYLTGGARVELGLKSLLLTPVSLLRTVAQVHGSLLALLARWPLALGAVALACVALGVVGLLGLRLAPRLLPAVATAPAGPAAVPTVADPARHVRRTFALIGGLQLLFAAQAAGNAEFMVMLPLLGALVLAGGRGHSWPGRSVAALGAAVLLWNVSFALLPAHVLRYTEAGPALRARVLRQPGAWWLLPDPNPLRNQLQYVTGQPAAARRVRGLAPPDTLRRWLTVRLAAGDTVYTTALGGPPPPLDRARLLRGAEPAALLAGFGAVSVDTLPTFFGPRYVSRLLLPSAARSQGSARARATVKAGASR